MVDILEDIIQNGLMTDIYRTERSIAVHNTIGEYAIEIKGKVTEEFPAGRENYCPQCYFENDEVIIRGNCSCHED